MGCLDYKLGAEKLRKWLTFQSKNCKKAKKMRKWPAKQRFWSHLRIFSASDEKTTSNSSHFRARILLVQVPSSNQIKKQDVPLVHPAFLCGGWDLNPHAVASTRSLVLLVCQFRHLRMRDFSENAKVIITYLFSFSTIIFWVKGLFTVFRTALAKNNVSELKKWR